jgi:hypothetical protein
MHDTDTQISCYKSPNEMAVHINCKLPQKSDLMQNASAFSTTATYLIIAHDLLLLLKKSTVFPDKYEQYYNTLQ